MVSKQDWKIAFIRRYLIPRLDKPKEWEKQIPEELVEEAEVVLAQAYWEEGRGIFTQFTKIGVPLLLIDVLFVFPTQIYGLIFSIIGTWILLIEADFQDRFSLAVQYGSDAELGTEPSFNSIQKKRLARQSVSANIGLVWLTFGFVFQILALIWFPSGNAIPIDLLS